MQIVVTRLCDSLRVARSALVWVALAIVSATSAGMALADVPVVYHSPLDDGEPATSSIDLAPGQMLTVFLYIDGGSEPSSGIGCASGTGDELCFWNVQLRGIGTASIANVVLEPGHVHHLAGDTLGINGGEPWRGVLGARRIGELALDGGAAGGGLVLTSGEAVDSGLAVTALPPATIVPEPATGSALWVGLVLLASLGRVRRAAIAPALLLALGLTTTVEAQQTSMDCGDVVPDGVIDHADLDGLRRFLAGDPGAPDLQGDPAGLMRCDVSGDGLCDVADYARIRRYMLGLAGGLDATCPLAGTMFPPVVLAPPTVDQASSLSTDRASIRLSGSAEPDELIRIEGVPGLPTTATDLDGTWELIVPLDLGSLNLLDVRRDFGGGYLSEAVSISVTQTDVTGEGEIAGLVVDAASTSTPLAGATVTVHGFSTTTDGAGRFTIAGLPAGRSLVRVELAGYVPSVTPAETNTSLGPFSGEARAGLEVRLVPRAASQIVGAAGGSMTTASGIELIVPPGALAVDTPIALTETWAGGSTGLDGVPTVDIGPGPIAFDPPAILRLPIAGFAPGQPADYLQVAQATGSLTSRIGPVGGSGSMEVAIQSTVGDGMRMRFRAYPSERKITGPQEGEEPLVRRIAVENCEDTGPRFEQFSGRRELSDFLGNPDNDISPEFATILEEVPKLFAHVQGLTSVKSSADQVVQIPPGTIGMVEVTETFFLIEQPIHAFWFPEGGGDFTRDRIGTLSYLVFVPTSAVVTDTFPCSAPGGSAWGDPHLIRFDHVGQALSHTRGDGRFDFQASGEFILFESTEDAMVVQARMQPANNSTTVTRQAAMNVDGDRVTIHAASVLDVRIEGVATPLTPSMPVSLPGGGEVERIPEPNRDVVFVRWADGSELRASESTTSFAGTYLNLYPTLAPRRAAKVRGLLGNANDVLGDDLNLRDGTPADPGDLYTTYADSWRISPGESLFDYGPGESPGSFDGTPVDPDFTLDDLDPVLVAQAEIACNAAGVVDEPGLSDCILDVAVFDDAAAAGAADEARTEVPANGEAFMVDGQAAIFGAGLGTPPDFGGGGGEGVLPEEIPLPVGSGRSIRVMDAAGAVQVAAGASAANPAGLPLYSKAISWRSWGGLSGPISDRSAELMGVFLDANTRPLVVPPPFDCTVRNSRFLVPRVGQVFCVGDGSTSTGDARVILVPDTATRVFFGFAERNLGFERALDLPDARHVGDETRSDGLFALAPSPEGMTWQSAPFGVVTPDPVAARLVLDVADSERSSNEIWLNGRRVGSVPLTGADATTWLIDQGLALAPDLLQPTGNVLEIRAGVSEGNADDFLFRALRIEVVEQQ